MTSVLSFLRARWAWLLGVGALALVLVRAYLAGAKHAATEAHAEVTRARKARAVRYQARAQAQIAEANRDARRREAVTKPDRGDWAELKRINERLDREDKEQR